MLKSYRRFISIFKCYSLSCVLDYSKIGKFYQNAYGFCFFKIWFWIGQYDPFHTKIDKFYFVFKEFCYFWVLSLRNGCIFQHQLKKLRHDPEIPKKLFFWKYVKSKHMGLSFKSHLKHLILKVAVRLSCIASVPS